jgi:DMSO/TMAO reductase YedYZ heme-binding membrane subunit
MLSLAVIARIAYGIIASQYTLLHNLIYQAQTGLGYRQDDILP